MISPNPGVRQRNAAATRAAILDSARRHFARESYENVGLREISRDAGVDPALVARYFGNKESLFREAVRHEGEPMLAGVPRDKLAERLTSLVLDDDAPGAPMEVKIDQLMMLLRSASSPKASQIIRDTIDEDFLRPIAKELGGEDAELSGGLSLAVMMGLGILRSAMEFGPLRDVDLERLRSRVHALMETALDCATDIKRQPK